MLRNPLPWARWSYLGLAIWLLALPCLPESRALGLAFDAPVALSSASEAGVNAFSFYAPPGSDASGARLEVLVHTLPAAVAAEMRASGADPFANGKTVYLGVNGPASSLVKRTLLGRDSVGEFYPQVLKKYAIECHWAVLPDGRELLLAFRRPLSTPQEELDSLAEAVCKSLRPSP